MLSWYRSKLKEHGAPVATRLLSQVVWAMVRTRVANKFLPQKVACPCCGWKGRRFYDFIEVGCRALNAECPQCNSHPRHRSLYLWLKSAFPLESKSGVGLIFAPEKSLESVWTQATRLRVYRVDIETARGVDVLADIQRLPFATDSVDFIWCHHVLTQIENDHLAMKELYRVLRPRTGELVLSAATTDSPATEEFGFANKDLLGFWRIYGRDFADRIAGNGFQVQAVRFELPVEESQRYATAGAEEFYLCVKPDLS